MPQFHFSEHHEIVVWRPLIASRRIRSVSADEIALFNCLPVSVVLLPARKHPERAAQQPILDVAIQTGFVLLGIALPEVVIGAIVGAPPEAAAARSSPTGPRPAARLPRRR